MSVLVSGWIEPKVVALHKAQPVDAVMVLVSYEDESGILPTLIFNEFLQDRLLELCSSAQEFYRQCSKNGATS